MYKYLFQIMVLCALLLSFTNMAVADGYNDYTTKRGKKTKKYEKAPDFLDKNPAYYNTERKCSAEDLKIIRKLNHKSKRKIEKYKELENNTENVKTPKDALKFSKEMKEIKDFFESEKFNAAKKLYKRCNIEVPRIKHKPLFWTP